MKCYRCGKLGHSERECYSTQRDSGPPTKTCSYCGKFGHLERDCYSAPRDSRDSGQQRPPKTCSYCGKLGHLERDCYSAQRDSRESEQQGQRPPKTCYYCGKLGHIQRDCWSAIADKNENSDSRSNTDGDSRSNTDGDSQENFGDRERHGSGHGQGYRQGGYRYSRDERAGTSGGPRRKIECYNCGQEVIDIRKHKKYDCHYSNIDDSKKERPEASPAETLRSLRPGPVDPNSYLSRTKGLDYTSETENQEEIR